MVETLSPQGANHSLRDSVRGWRVDWSGDGVDADAASASAEVTAVNGIAITQQVAWLLSPGRGLDELPPDPGRRGVGRHVDMHQLASTMRDEDQHVQRLEGQRGHGEQIGRPQMMGMVAPERAPGLARRARWSDRKS